MNDSGKHYSSNALAVIVSIVISVIMSAVYIIMMDVAVDIKVVIEILILAYLSFLIATLGYDKVIQTIRQIRNMNGDVE